MGIKVTEWAVTSINHGSDTGIWVWEMRHSSKGHWIGGERARLPASGFAQDLRWVWVQQMGLHTPITENILLYVRQLNTLQPLFFFRKYKWKAVEDYGISGSQDLKSCLLRSYNMCKVILWQDNFHLIKRTASLFMWPNTGLPLFIVLCWCFLQIEGTAFHQQKDYELLCCNNYFMRWSGTEPAIYPRCAYTQLLYRAYMSWIKQKEDNSMERYSNALIMTDLSCVIMCYFLCPLLLNKQWKYLGEE